MRPSWDLRIKTFPTSDGSTNAYTLRGASVSDYPRMVFIHSLGFDASLWDDVGARLAKKAGILTYDCRGHGKSEREAGAFTVELFAQDLAELLNHVGWEAAIVVGCSMGGCVAQAFAGLYPARVRAMGLIDTTAWYGPDALRLWEERAAAARTKGLRELIEFQLTRWFSDAFRAAHPDRVKRATSVFLANDLECYAASCAMLGRMDLRPYLSRLGMPVAIMVGEDDQAVPVSESRQLHKAIANSTLTVFPGARHLTPIECADLVTSQLDALVDALPS